ncbi:hypothetical protein PYCCODRAFT_1198817 [Trametes coccinea BRFM310]|uniref:Uncharacterized protein n=1 Tax=Trametes coccinea (strain BRFM310) TaxID=1353009 RepID=A0A1Y2I7H1_TRAC3|nr:hypothetical protein PYCCODRAFT_1198817 [Trametes coccinea BRFM310]
MRHSAARPLSLEVHVLRSFEFHRADSSDIITTYQTLGMHKGRPERDCIASRVSQARPATLPRGRTKQAHLASRRIPFDSDLAASRSNRASSGQSWPSIASIRQAETMCQCTMAREASRTRLPGSAAHACEDRNCPGMLRTFVSSPRAVGLTDTRPANVTLRYACRACMAQYGLGLRANLM